MFRTMNLPDGRTLEYAIADGGSDVLVYHHGTPAAGPLDDHMVAAARACDLTLVELIRPGYGRSASHLGRRVADVVPLVTALADHLGAERFVTMGWSGGGPHALATAARVPDRCAAALSLAGVAPFDADGLDWLAGMGEDNVHEFGAAVAGVEDLTAFLDEAAGFMKDITGEQVAEGMASLLPAADLDYLNAGYAEAMAAELRWSIAHGIDGWRDDDLAFCTPWGFDVTSISVPVQVWQGTADLMVPANHGRWLADHLPNADIHLIEGAGHLSVAHQAMDVGFPALRRALDSATTGE